MSSPAFQHTSSSSPHTLKPVGPSVATKIYLRAICIESQLHPHVSLGCVATHLGVSTPAVSRKVKALVRSGHIRRDGACGLMLTERGQTIALRALRKLEVVETFLVKQLGYGWHEVFQIAFDMSLHLDDAVVERMYELMGQPSHCPHGHPIPTRTGALAVPTTQALTKIPVNTQAQIACVNTREPELLRYLASISLVPGTWLKRMPSSPYSGLLCLHVLPHNDEILLGSEAAVHVQVHL